MSLADQNSVRHLQQLLVDRKIFCRNPADFNDPWDCAILANPGEDAVSDRGFQQQVFEWLRHSAIKHLGSFPMIGVQDFNEDPKAFVQAHVENLNYRESM